MKQSQNHREFLSHTKSDHHVKVLGVVESLKKAVEDSSDSHSNLNLNLDSNSNLNERPEKRQRSEINEPTVISSPPVPQRKRKEKTLAAVTLIVQDEEDAVLEEILTLSSPGEISSFGDGDKETMTTPVEVEEVEEGKEYIHWNEEEPEEMAVECGQEQYKGDANPS